jgi:hypothetical protein
MAELAAVLVAASCGGAERVSRKPDGGGGGSGGRIALAGMGGATGGAAGGSAGSSGAAGSDAGATGGGGGGGGGGTGDARPCSPGNALQFDGAFDRLMVARPIQNDFTIEAWIKTSTTSLTGTHFWEGNGLIYADVRGAAADFGTSILGNKLAFGVGDIATIQSVTSVNTGAWVHVAATRVQATGAVAVLINGAVEASATPALTTPLDAPTSITIGGNTIDNRYFTGAIDELRLWSVARSAAEIQATMHQVLTGSEAGLVGYWRFDESSGSTAADASPSGNTATVDTTGDGGAMSAPVHVPSDAPVCP